MPVNRAFKRAVIRDRMHNPVVNIMESCVRIIAMKGYFAELADIRKAWVL